MVSTYLNSLMGAGLVPALVREPRPDESWARDREGAGALPLYLAMRALKVAFTSGP